MLTQTLRKPVLMMNLPLWPWHICFGPFGKKRLLSTCPSVLPCVYLSILTRQGERGSLGQGG